MTLSRMNRFMVWTMIAFSTISLSPATVANTAALNHGLWTQLLAQHVKVINEGSATQVDYAGFKRDHALLKQYLKQLSQLSRTEFDQLDRENQLAFLINAYNAWTIELIVQQYPDLKSIRDLGSFFQSPWKKAFIPLLGDTLSLDDIEHHQIRGSNRYQEPRIHFAVNCASVGCPALRNEAYEGPTLEQQLEAQTKLFLRDRDRNYLKGGVLYISKIFDWYGEDFEYGWRNTKSLATFLASYADSLDMNKKQLKALTNGETKIKFTPYDWMLNDISH